MKKILIIIVLIVMTCLCLAGCGNKQQELNVIYNTFIVIQCIGSTDGTECYKVYDKDTKIIYLYITNTKGNYISSSISVYYGADGNPLLYKGTL